MSETTKIPSAGGSRNNRAAIAGGRTVGGSAAAAESVPERMAWALGLLGLIPFMVMTALFLYAGRNFIAFPQLVLGFSGYSATILAFLGGIRWGLGLIPGHHRRRILLLSVLPALVGWILLFVPIPWSFACFAVAFALLGVWDRLAARGRTFPRWFSLLRVVLTVVVVLCQLAAFAALWG